MSRYTTEERFWSKVDAGGDCWLWTAGRTPEGYGKYSITASDQLGAHRFAYEALVGPIPPGLTLDHLCRTLACVNPDHLEPVSRAENIRRSPGGRASINARKTQCPHGHPYDDANTDRYVWRGRVHRRCLACRASRHRALSARRAADRVRASQ